MDRVSKRLSSGLQAICAGMQVRATRAGVVLRTFRNCYSEAIRQARLVDNDRLAQKHYRKLYGAGDLPSPESETGMPRTGSSADWREHPVASESSLDSGVHELNVQAAEQ